MKIRNISLEKDYNSILKLDLETAKIILRKERKPQLLAYDTYKTSVNYGDIIETDAEREEIAAWKNSILDLDNIEHAVAALKNVPAKVKYYM